MPPGSEVLELVRLRGMERTPICLDETVLPLDLAAPLREADLEDTSLYEQLESLCDVRIHRSAYSVRAEVADEELAACSTSGSAGPSSSARRSATATPPAPSSSAPPATAGDAYKFQADLFRPL